MSQEKNNSDKEQKPTHPDPQQDKTRPMTPYEAPESGGPADIDEGPSSEPVDDIQEALVDAARHGESTEINFDELPEPVPELDEGPRPVPVDDIQEAIFEASQKGAPTELDFDALPEPGSSGPKKVIRFENHAPAEAAAAETSQGPAYPAEPAYQDTVYQETAQMDEPDTPETPSAEPPQVETTPPSISLPASDIWLLLALFLVFRLLTLFLLKPGGFIRDWSDFDTYYGIAGLTDFGLYPFLDFWLEWPPLVPWLMAGAYKLSLLLPPWPEDARLWFILILGSVFVLFEVANFALIYRLAKRFIQTPDKLKRVMWLYAGLFPPVYAMLGFFDAIALFFILLSLELLLADKRLLSAAATGVGFMVKIIPVLMLPVALRRLWFQYRHNNKEAAVEMGLYLVAAGLTVILLLTPFIIIPALADSPQWWVTSFRSILGRSGWETVWAVADGYTGFGMVNGDRLSATETNFAIDYVPQIAGWVWGVITLAFAALYVFIFTRPADYNQPKNVLAFGGLTVATFMLWSKGYSPQFLVYLLPFIILLFPNGRGLTYALILTILNILEQPIYFVLLPQATWLLTLIVVIRFLVITLIALEFSVEIWGRTQPLASLEKLRPYIPLALGSLFAVVLLILTPFMIRAYSTEQLAQNPANALIGFMKAQSQNLDSPTCPTGPESQRLYVGDQITYRQLYPYLRQNYALHVTSGAPESSDFPTIAELLPDSGPAWVLSTGPQGKPLANQAEKKGHAVETYTFENLGPVSLYNFSDVNMNCHPVARFRGSLELVTHHIETKSGAINATLFWQARSPQEQNLTVFIHLLDDQGQWIAGHDSVPKNGMSPVTTWAIDTVQSDAHRIQLPANLPAGNYTLVTGIYNDAGTRLSAFDISGVSYEGRSVPLTTLQLP